MPKRRPPTYESDLTLEGLIRSSLAQGRPRYHNYNPRPPSLPVPANAPTRLISSRNQASQQRGGGRGQVQEPQGEVVLATAPESAGRSRLTPRSPAWSASAPAGRRSQELRESLRQVLEIVLDELEDSANLEDDDDDDEGESLGRHRPSSP
jgi:hypothetical protein